MSVTSRLLKEVNDVTECPICLQTMTNPKILPCIHTFCLNCLQQSGKNVSTKSDPNCPLCRSPFSIPVGGYSGLPNNYFVEKLINAKKSTSEEYVRGKSCDVCLASDKKQKSIPAKMYCMECLEYMCDQCSDIHKSMKVSRAHRLRSTGECPSLKECLELSASYCEQHPNKEVEIYCKDCEKVCCMMCYIQNHQSHKCCDVIKVADDFKVRIKSDLVEIEKLISDNKKQTGNVQSMSKNYVKSVDLRKSEIAEKSEKLKALVDKHKSILLDELEKKKQNQLKEYNSFEKDLQLQMISFESFKRYSSEVIDKARPADIARVANDLRDRAATLKHQTVTKVVKQATIRLDAGDIDQMVGKKNWNIVGKLSSSPLNMSSTSVNYRETPSLKKKLQLNGHLRGIAVLNNEMFIAIEGCSEIQVFGCDTMVCERRISVQGMVWDIVSHGDSLFVGLNNSLKKRVMYIDSDDDEELNAIPHLNLNTAKNEGNSIMRIDMPDMQIVDWSIYDKRNQNFFSNQRSPIETISLSITKNGNLLLCYATENKLIEYTKEGTLVRKISVDFNPNPEPNVKTATYRSLASVPYNSVACNISQAFHLKNDQFVVLTTQSNVYILNSRGKLIENNRQQSKQPTPCATCIFVDQNDLILVTNQQTDQLTLLNSSLDPVKVILPHFSSHSEEVSKLFVDQRDGKLYFNDVETNVLTIMQFQTFSKPSLSVTSDAFVSRVRFLEHVASQYEIYEHFPCFVQN